MQQKERDELQGYLNERIFATKRQKRSVSANAKLTQKQKDDLYQVVKDIRNLAMDKVKDGEALDNALKTVAACLQQLNFHGMMPNPKDSKNIVPRDKMPFLVKQVLWLICYKALQAGRKREDGQKQKGVLTQKDVFEELENYGIYVSHNFFSSLELTPDYYLRCEEYSQPENLCTYKGQKKNELAVAIKNLVYQAGQHSYFVDVFGGSGSASTAVCRKRRVEYVYNEKDTAVYNYVKTLASDDYTKVIERLQIVRDDLLSPDKSTYSSYMKFNVCEVIGKYIDSKPVRNQKDIIGREREIQGYADVDFEIDEERLEQLMQNFPNEIQRVWGDVKKQWKKKKIFRGINSAQKIKEMHTKEDFYRHENDFYYLSVNKIPLWGLALVKDMYAFDEITYDEWRKMLRQYKTLGYYAYFYLLRKTKGTGINRAVGEIFLNALSTRESIVSSAIIYDGQTAMFGKAYHDIYNFTEKDLKSTIKVFHDALAGTIIENKDFRNIIKDYSSKKERVLFYSDSPYIATSDYKEKFEADDMKDLVRGLLKSGADKNKFIFSMRAVKTAEDVEGKDKVSKIVKGNEEIYQYVYKEFELYEKPLYVLVICKENEDLAELFQESKVVEIMITNYKIVSFEIGKEGEEKYLCEAFTFKDYMKLIRSNMVGYQKDW